MANVHAPLAELNEALESSLEREGPALEGRVAVMTAHQRYLMDARHLEEIGTVGHVSRLGRMPPHVLGLASFRGLPYTLVDASGLLGDSPIEEVEQAWAVLLRDAHIDVALVWPQITGLFPLGAYTLDSDFPALPFTSQALLDLNGQRWHELDVPALLDRLRHLSNPDFIQEAVAP